MCQYCDFSVEHTVAARLMWRRFDPGDTLNYPPPSNLQDINIARAFLYNYLPPRAATVQMHALSFTTIFLLGLRQFKCTRFPLQHYLPPRAATVQMNALSFTTIFLLGLRPFKCTRFPLQLSSSSGCDRSNERAFLYNYLPPRTATVQMHALSFTTIFLLWLRPFKCTRFPLQLSSSSDCDRSNARAFLYNYLPPRAATVQMHALSFTTIFLLGLRPFKWTRFPLQLSSSSDCDRSNARAFLYNYLPPLTATVQMHALSFTTIFLLGPFKC